MSNKKDGLEIFELFRHGSPKSASPETPPPAAPPPPPKERVTAVRHAPAARPEPKAETVERAEATLTMRVNTALFGLMIGTACLFGTFALGVQFERRHHPAVAAAPADEARTAALDEAPPAQLPGVIHETPRRDPVPAPPQNNETHPQPPAEPKKGFTLQLYAYPADQESTAQSMVARIQGQAGGADALLVKDKQGNFVVVGGFVEKRDGQEAEALMTRYRKLANTMRKTFNLDWISMTK